MIVFDEWIRLLYMLPLSYPKELQVSLLFYPSSKHQSIYPNEKSNFPPIIVSSLKDISKFKPVTCNPCFSSITSSIEIPKRLQKSAFNWRININKYIVSLYLTHGRDYLTWFFVTLPQTWSVWFFCWEGFWKKSMIRMGFVTTNSHDEVLDSKAITCQLLCGTEKFRRCMKLKLFSRQKQPGCTGKPQHSISNTPPSEITSQFGI